MSRFNFLAQRKEQGDLLDVDVYFAEFIADLARTADPQLVNLFAELSHAQHTQQSCLDRTLADSLPCRYRMGSSSEAP